MRPPSPHKVHDPPALDAAQLDLTWLDHYCHLLYNEGFLPVVFGLSTTHHRALACWLSRNAKIRGRHGVEAPREYGPDGVLFQSVWNKPVRIMEDDSLAGSDWIRCYGYLPGGHPAVLRNGAAK